MLSQSWELYATDLANASDNDSLVKCIELIIKEESIDLNRPALIAVARDTRFYLLLSFNKIS